MTGAAARTWAALVVAVMVEFAYVFWCADALAAWAGVRPELAASAPLLFVGGMTVGRGMATAVANHRAALHLSLSGALLAAGTVVFMLASHPALAALALVAAGLGLAPWYPALLARLIHESADSATGSGWGAVGSGVALLLSPQLLGRLADRLSLAAAFRVVPVLVVVLLANHLLGDGRRTPREAAPR